MTLAKYRHLFADILMLAEDAESFGVFEDTITEEQVEKSKYIIAMLEVLKDVPERKAENVISMKDVTFNYDEILDSIGK